MKLLAKTAEDRYQTAAGAGSDLQRCLHEWETQNRIDDFPLGEHDTPDRLLIQEKLYGRESEIDTLLAAFDRVVAGAKPELVLVSGYSGIGKTSLVNELHKWLVPSRGLFASGKFDEYKRDIPYATLAQAFQQLIQALLGKSETELSRWRDALREALDPNGQLIVDLVPNLELIIGEQPPAPELSPQDAQRRFQLVFRRFIGVFARPEHPLALFLDDLQWLDAATLDLLENVLTRSDLQHLMLIGAYRDNEVTPAHPLMRRIEAIRNAGASVNEVRLPPLAREHVDQLIADALHCEPGRAAPLGQLVYEKTAGNPFFVIQFLFALADEGLLAFDHRACRWSWDVARIRAKGYTANVADLIVGKLTRLQAGTQEALQQLACLGNSADLTTLALVRGTSEEQLHADLWEAVRLELIERLDGAYRFLHDRVQEAAYSLIPEPSRADAHLRIGRLLVAHTPRDQREEVIFEIVNQLNRGVALISSPDEREELAELNLMAGKRAKNATAYASALTYLTAGRTLLPEDSWERYGALTFAFEIHRAECEFLTGAFAAAEERLSIAVRSRCESCGQGRCRLPANRSLHNARPSRPRCGDLRRIPAGGRHRLLTAPDEGRDPARIRANVAPDRESLDRGTRRTAANDKLRGARDHGRANRGPGSQPRTTTTICSSSSSAGWRISAWSMATATDRASPTSGSERSLECASGITGSGSAWGSSAWTWWSTAGCVASRHASTYCSRSSLTGRSPSVPASAWCGAPSTRPTGSATSPSRAIAILPLSPVSSRPGNRLQMCSARPRLGSISRADSGSELSST